MFLWDLPRQKLREESTQLKIDLEQAQADFAKEKKELEVEY